MPRLFDAAYLSALSLSMPWLIYQSARTGKYRRGWGDRLFGARPNVDPTRHRIWIHAVSLGEVLVARRLVQEFARLRPDLQILLSTTTESGLHVAFRIPEAEVFRAPLDFSWAVERVADQIAPSLIVLTELELWPNLLLTAQERNVPVCVVNARLSSRSHEGYRRLRSILGPGWKAVRWWGAQNEEYAVRIADLLGDRERVEVTGSLKYDGALRDRTDASVVRLGRVLGVDTRAPVWVAGSTMAPEESIVLEVFKQLKRREPRLRLLLVPRHPERFEEVAKQLDASGLRYARRSRHTEANPAREDVVLVDTVGELASLWGLATFGFVGGSLTSARGGQSMIEPAGFGVPTCFGPSTRNFQSTVDQLLKIDGARVVFDRDALVGTLETWLARPVDAADLGARARQFIESQQGSLARTLAGLEPFLPKIPRPRRVA